MDRKGIGLEWCARRALAGVVALVAGSAAGLEATTQIEAGSVSGAPGSSHVLSVTLHTDVLVTGTQNDLTYDSETAIAARPSGGAPDCWLGDAVPPLTRETFVYLPRGCSPGVDCTGLSALLVASDFAAPIADGTVLYSCTVAIASDATAGTHPITVANPFASDVDSLIDASGIDGSVVVGAPTATTQIEAGTVRGAPGSTRTVSVTLHTGVPISGIQNDLELPDAATVLTRTDGKPDCRLGNAVPRISALTATFPYDRYAHNDNCRVIRLLIFEVSPFDAIPDGTVLYTCVLTVAADAAAGSYPIIVSRASARDPNGNAVEPSGVDGAIIVDAPTPTPTATPFGVDPPTATRTATRTRTRTPYAGSDTDSCAVARGQSRDAWWLLLPLLAMWRRRAR